VLRAAKGVGVYTKSSIMLGLGETDEEVEECLLDLYDCGVDIVTLGQYLQPTPRHLEVVEFVTPEKFEHWRQFGEDVVGFRCALLAHTGAGMHGQEAGRKRAALLWAVAAAVQVAFALTHDYSAYKNTAAVYKHARLQSMMVPMMPPAAMQSVAMWPVSGSVHEPHARSVRRMEPHVHWCTECDCMAGSALRARRAVSGSVHEPHVHCMRDAQGLHTTHEHEHCAPCDQSAWHAVLCLYCKLCSACISSCALRVQVCGIWAAGEVILQSWRVLCRGDDPKGPPGGRAVAVGIALLRSNCCHAALHAASAAATARQAHCMQHSGLHAATMQPLTSVFGSNCLQPLRNCHEVAQ
jgi:hypothetical protein